MNRRTIIVSLLIAAGMAVLIAFMVNDLLPLIRAFLDNDTDIAAHIETYGARGVPMLIALQILQIILPIIPAASIAALSGLLYGVWQGAVINMTGRILGNMIMFVAWRKMRNLMARIWPQNEEKQGFLTRIMAKVNNPGIAATLIIFMPGIPYSLTPYMFAKTKMPLTQYLAAVIIGNLPWAFLYAYLGDSVADGNYTTALILLGIVAAVVIAAVAVRRKLRRKPKETFTL
ncbi:MAG: VTT domain-containing protein [Oscillospiraceae bacterium]|nr:VTT domain-containing protein [Oscillospiraceae bacterium]